MIGSWNGYGNDLYYFMCYQYLVNKALRVWWWNWADVMFGDEYYAVDWFKVYVSTTDHWSQPVNKKAKATVANGDTHNMPWDVASGDSYIDRCSVADWAAWRQLPGIVYGGYCVTESWFVEAGALCESCNERRPSLVAQQTTRQTSRFSLMYTISLGSYTIPFITTARGHGLSERFG